MAENPTIMEILWRIVSQIQPIMGDNLKADYHDQDQSSMTVPSHYCILREVPVKGWFFSEIKSSNILLMLDPEQQGSGPEQHFEIRVLSEPRIVSIVERCIGSIAAVLPEGIKARFAVKAYSAGEV